MLKCLKTDTISLRCCGVYVTTLFKYVYLNGYKHINMFKKFLFSCENNYTCLYSAKSRIARRKPSWILIQWLWPTRLQKEAQSPEGSQCLDPLEGSPGRKQHNPLNPGQLESTFWKPLLFNTQSLSQTGFLKELKRQHHMNFTKLVVPLHFISWKKTPNNAVMHHARVNSHQRWKQIRFHVCFHLLCELTSTMNVTEWQVSWNSCFIIYGLLAYNSPLLISWNNTTKWGP